MNMAGKSYEVCPDYHLKAMTLHEVAVDRGITVRSAPTRLSRDQVAPLKARGLHTVQLLSPPTSLLCLPRFHNTPLVDAAQTS